VRQLVLIQGGLVPSLERRQIDRSIHRERIREVKRRTRVATLFPNTESLLRLAASVVMEISEDWETGRIYLSMDTE